MTKAVTLQTINLPTEDGDENKTKAGAEGATNNNLSAATL
jgi:hypothetical protein